MPKRGNREDRHEALIELLAQYQIKHQSQLVSLLKQRGIRVTQSAISRDLQQLGATRVKGIYEVPARPADPAPFLKVLTHIKSARPVAPYYVLIVTEPNAGVLVARGVDAAGFREVMGTVAGADSVLLLTDSDSAQKRLFNRIKMLFAGKG